MVVKRLTLKGLWTNAEMEQWSRAAIRVCEVYALVKELSNLEELTLYACSLHPCPHQNGCPFVGTYGLAKPLKRLDLDGVMVVPGNRDETPPRVSQSKDIFFLLESLNPNTLLVQGGRWSGSWESTDVTLPTKARSIHWVSSPIPTRFEVVEGLERLYAQPWIEHASLKRIIEGARASLTWVCLVCTLIGAPFPGISMRYSHTFVGSGHDHHLPILALNQCTALSEANLWIKLTIPSGTSRFTSSAVWNLVESFVSQLPECTITLGLRLDIGDGAAYDAVGKFLSGGRWVEVVGGFLRTCLNRRANIEIRGLCQRRDGLQEDRLKALWLLQEIPAVFQEAGFASEYRRGESRTILNLISGVDDRVRYIGFEKATSDLMTLQE